MLHSLDLIKKFKQGDLTVLKTNHWLKYLALTHETNINMERVDSIEELQTNLVLSYVERTLLILEQLELPEFQTKVIEEVLTWSEVAKCGMNHHRKQWMEKGYNLFVHNIGSAQIYQVQTNLSEDAQCRDLIYILVYTHGLIGQYIRGEVPIHMNKALTELVRDKVIARDILSNILISLNHCIIAGVSPNLWDIVKVEVNQVIQMVVDNQYDREIELFEKMRRLRTLAVQNGENYQQEYEKVFACDGVADILKKLFTKTDLWFVEAALYDFSFEEFIKIFLLIYRENDFNKIRHISFEKLMKGLYYQHEGKKRINIYKKRVIEKYLASQTLPEIMTGMKKMSPHVEHRIEIDKQLDDTVFFDLRFSPAGEKLIDFCSEAEKADLLYEKAIVLLFDLFELRRDKYDRFHEEEKYLVTMNSGVDYKKIVLDYIIGNEVLDIGPGGGVLMDLIEDTFPKNNVTGVDISQNVIDTLRRKKQNEHRKWQIIYGDALNLSEYLKPGSIDTVIFCSIIHELYSYIEFEGEKFNQKTIAKALKSAFDVLTPGGRIIIRDGIMTEPVNQKRIIKFLSDDGLNFLTRYTADFKGRKIEYRISGHNEIIMPVNDAMEFLYTYTWGEKSYVHEVNEQFGYFTPTEYIDFIQETLGKDAEIIECRHFLQDGYATALSSRIELSDEDKKPVPLPDSTCLVVIQKQVINNHN
jgi:SAM-dependent methyltransferase